MYRLALLVTLLAPTALFADTLTIPLGSQGADLDASNLPHKGQSKRAVL